MSKYDMFTFKAAYPDLGRFFALYCNEDADYASVDELVRDFCKESSNVEVMEVLKDLDRFMATDAAGSSADVEQLLLGAGMAYYPGIDNLDYLAWLYRLKELMLRYRRPATDSAR